MDRSKVKTLLILLLLAADLFLSGLWVSRELRDYARRRTMEAELTRVLAEAGLTLSAPLPDTAAAELEARRNPASERAAAEALLGPCEAEDPGGGITNYTGPMGRAQFRKLGEFDITLTEPRALSDPETDIKALAREMGLWSGEDARLERDADGYAYEVREHALPVWENRVSFKLDRNGALEAIKGTRLLGGEYTPGAAGSRSAGWALLSLAWALLEEGAPPSELLSMELGYRPSTLASETVRLTPYWYVRLTDETGQERNVYINAISGEPSLRE